MLNNLLRKRPSAEENIYSFYIALPLRETWKDYW